MQHFESYFLVKHTPIIFVLFTTGFWVNELFIYICYSLLWHDYGEVLWGFLVCDGWFIVYIVIKEIKIITFEVFFFFFFLSSKIIWWFTIFFFIHTYEHIPYRYIHKSIFLSHLKFYRKKKTVYRFVMKWRAAWFVDEIKGLETIIVIFEDLKWIILQEFTF